MILKALKGIFLFIIGAAAFIALMRAFGWDPFGLISWLTDFIMYSITRLADIFTPYTRTAVGH